MGIRFFLPYILLLIISFTSATAACECEHLSLRAEYVKATNVYCGKVLSIAKNDTDGTEDRRSLFLISDTVMVQITEVLKGTPDSLERVAADGPINCGVIFKPGETYLVFVDSNGAASRCTGTRLLTIKNTAVLKKLRHWKLKNK